MRLSSFRAALLALPLSFGAIAGAGFAAVPVQAHASAPVQAHDAPNSFADLAQQLLPAVVNISSTQTVKAEQGGPEDDVPGLPPGVPPGSPFDQFFRDFMERQRGARPDATPRRAQSLGSGFIIDPSGIVVTNNHVIANADEITVTLQDNTILKATLIGKDDRMDLAVLQVHSPKPLPAVPFGDSDKMRVGDWVLAIGNPFGLGGTVTAGIVSARSRDIRQGPYDDFLQTDAAINRGNSGGPLFNMSGDVIGINTAIYSPSGGSIGIGFAIPSDMAKTVVAQLVKFHHARRGWLGVRIQQVTPDIADSLGLHVTGGALVAGVNENGPADKAHLHDGDVVLKFDGQDLKEMRSLPRIVAETPVGKTVPVEIWRDGKNQTVTVTVAEMPEDKAQVAAVPVKPADAPHTPSVTELGLTVAAITPEARERFQLSPGQKGVVILQVTGEAAQDGIRPGDVIVEAQQETVNAPGALKDKIEQLRKQGRKSILLLIQSGEGERWVPLPLKAPAADAAPAPDADQPE